MKVEVNALILRGLGKGDFFVKLPQADNGHGGEAFDGSCDLYQVVAGYPLNILHVATGDLLVGDPDAPVIKINRRI